MSRKPVLEKSKDAILNALGNVGKSKKEWARALDVTTSAIEGWLKRERIPQEIWNRIDRWDKSQDSLNNNPKLKDFSDKDLVDELENRHPGWKVELVLKSK